MEFHFPLSPFPGGSAEVAEDNAMKLLRDESVEMLILTPPDAASASVSQDPVVHIPAKAVPPAPFPVAHRAAKVHCRFFCRWCDSVILLPHEQIGQPFASPFLRKIEVRAIATVCDSCSHVAAFSLFRGSPGYDTRHSLMPAEPQDEVALVDWLKCEENTCSYPMPLFVMTRQPLSVETARELGLHWHWDELCCTAGHRILAPLWIFGRAPYKFPAPLR